LGKNFQELHPSHAQMPREGINPEKFESKKTGRVTPKEKL